MFLFGYLIEEVFGLNYLIVLIMNFVLFYISDFVFIIFKLVKMLLLEVDYERKIS